MNAKKIFLLPGEYIISKKPHLASTLLGSCVAVTLYSKAAEFGGINHYMLPNSPSNERSPKYGNYSINTMLQFMKRGAGSLNGVKAMIFGGASVVGAITSGANIGEKNIKLAKKMLRDNNIPITKEVTGGETGMKIKYQTWDNEIEYRYIQRSQFSETLLAKQAHFDKHKIKVLIVDDSSLVRSLLAKAMADEPDIEVVGQAKDAFEAREMVIEKGPDVITLDIIMPGMDGVTFLKKLMVYFPVPVIIVSTIAKTGSKAELRADKIGAVDVLDKEELKIYAGLETIKSILIPKIRSASRTIVRKKNKDDVINI